MVFIQIKTSQDSVVFMNSERFSRERASIGLNINSLLLVIKYEHSFPVLNSFYDYSLHRFSIDSFHLEQHATGSVAFINLEHLLTRTHLNVLLLTTYDHPFALRFQ